MWAKGAFLLATAVCLCSAGSTPSLNWGFHGHREINQLAINTLPQEMFGYYKRHADWIRTHAVDPDKRRYGVIGEAEKHYIDIDYYCHADHDTVCNPFGLVPRKWKDAVSKFSEDTLRAYGIVPWAVNNMVFRLTKAFKQGDHKRVLRVSAELGHYVGDAHVPLHTTENYNGQLTGQKGIHGFWESRIPELYDDSWDLLTGKAAYIEDPLGFIWDRVEESHAAVDSVLRFERELNERFPEDQKFAYEERGQALVRTYSEGYSKAYDLALNGQVERRMKQAILSLGSFWYTAWVNAGQPNLETLDQSLSLDSLEIQIQEENSLPAIPELQDRSHE